MTIDSGVVTNVADLLWGNSGTANRNTLIITNGGKFFTGAAGTIWNVGRGTGSFSNTVIITGSGRASKEQVQRTIQRELGLATMPDPPDVADALAVALCHYYRSRTL